MLLSNGNTRSGIVHWIHCSNFKFKKKIRFETSNSLLKIIKVIPNYQTTVQQTVSSTVLVVLSCRLPDYSVEYYCKLWWLH